MHAAHRTEVGDKDSIISLLHTSPVRYLAHFLLGKPKIQNTNRAENQSPKIVSERLHCKTFVVNRIV